MPLDQRNHEVYALTYTSDALGVELEVTGRPVGEIKVREHDALLGSGGVLRCLVRLEVTAEGKPHFQKSWTVSVPRASN
jgi:hypothetical protein